MSNVNDFAKTVTASFSKKITDLVFLHIQNDRTLMHKYLREVQKLGLDAVNQQIGKYVKKKYSLTNAASRQVSPKSTLIKSYQEFL